MLVGDTMKSLIDIPKGWRVDCERSEIGYWEIRIQRWADNGYGGNLIKLVAGAQDLDSAVANILQQIEDMTKVNKHKFH